MNISGALNPKSDSAEGHAIRVYENIRKQSTDVYYISQNTKFSYEQVSLIKGHIFYNKHELLNGEYDRFFPSYDMAESWRRLSSKNGKGIQQHDIIMLQHELLEIHYISQGYSQQDAHHKASLNYNYSKASDDYYRSLGFRF